MTAAQEDGGSEVVRLPQRTPFTMVDNPIIRAMSDYVALGLYLDMLSHPSGWRINIRDLAKTHKQGRQVLTDAMNDLIDRGLVFRVRFQESTGRWRTRTYVCSSPVSLGELRDIKEQYRGRCTIETSTELKPQLAGPGPGSRTISSAPPPSAETTPEPDPPPDHPDDAHSAASAPPSTRFPAPGDPDAGRPDAGPPGSSRAAPQRSEGSTKIPPSTPLKPVRPEPEEGEEVTDRQVNRGTASSPDPRPGHPDIPHVTAELVRAWPALGRRDLAQLEEILVEALEQVPTPQLVEHLVSNTGGVRHPLALLRARLANLPPPRPRRTSGVEWCGDCTSPTYRWIQDVDGKPVHPCPRCSPQVARRTPPERTRERD